MGFGYSRSIYEKFEKLVKEKGRPIETFFPGIEGSIEGIEGSIWQVKNLLVVIDELALLKQNKIIAVVDISDTKFFYIIYISPAAIQNGAKEFFGIINNRISSREKLSQIFEKIKARSQPNPGFFI